jgi:hypothetical protein
MPGLAARLRLRGPCAREDDAVNIQRYAQNACHSMMFKNAHFPKKVINKNACPNPGARPIENATEKEKAKEPLCETRRNKVSLIAVGSRVGEPSREGGALIACFVAMGLRWP